METRRDKIQKNNSEKNQEERERKSWADLPQDILAIILEKLHTVDQIRLHAVCKNWLTSKDRMIKYKDDPPWVCDLSWGVDGIECEVFDPYSHKEFKTSKSVEKLDYLSDPFDDIITVYGSKQGWLIVGCNYGIGWKIFMYNPHSNEVILLPYLEHVPIVATFSEINLANSQEREVFVFCCDRVSDEVYIASYNPLLSRDEEAEEEWRIEFLETTEDECCGMQYMNGQFLFLFDYAALKRYSLTDRSWTLLERGWERHMDPRMERLWLIKGEGDVLVACKLEVGYDVWSTFCFDWCNMSWVEKDLEGTAIFICGKTAMVTPLLDDDCENTEDCRVLFCSDSFGVDCKFTCYSFVERMMMEESQDQYGWIKRRYYDNRAFIEPPYIRR